ncbi:MAG: PIG-L family deacetylase [Bacteroidota bacterium]
MRIVFLLLVILAYGRAEAQYYRQPDAAAIRLKLKKLNTLGAVLYVAAHPDDENTLSIGWFANERLMTTGYLSMTRGDGGQNLIGGELRDKLGLIRTRELIAARGVDGGRQFFTRANDFGFSKNPGETLRIWDKQVILSDVLKVFRIFQPDVIITRFPPDARAGHGHHTSSALLALEAFDLASKPSSFPEQAKEVGTWQPRRLYLNVSRFFDPNVNEKTPGILTIDMGGYNPLLGRSYNELSAESRTMHKSQGFGSAARRGYLPEFFQWQKGDSVKHDLFEGINTTWTRVKGGERIQPVVNRAIDQFRDETPWSIVPTLLEVRKAIRSLEPGIWKSRKLAETEELIRDCMGLYAEITADRYHQVSGDQAMLNIQVVNRSSLNVKLAGLSIPTVSMDSVMGMAIGRNIPFTLTLRKKLKSGLPNSDPYWLREPHPQGYFTVSDAGLITNPENPPAMKGIFRFMLEGEELSVEAPVLFKSTDPVKGELYRPVEITPPVTISIEQPVLMFPDLSSREVAIRVTAVSGPVKTGSLAVVAPEGWQVMPASIPFELEKQGSVKSFQFRVTPPSAAATGELMFRAMAGDVVCTTSIEEINYDHIPVQTLQPPAVVKLVRTPVAKLGTRIGYVPGAGDEIPDALRAIGYEVTELKEPLPATSLTGFDAIVLGVRAVNANPVIRAFMPSLLQYAENGGTLIVQYNTNFDLAAERLAPYELRLSRFRVTEEDAQVRLLDPGHQVLNVPNKITTEDFNGWVQERGLYLPGTWAPQFKPILSMNDTGEPAGDGSVLVAPVGKGYYVYTALSFFRQLPEGVPGAYRLFANLVSLRTSVEAPAKRGKKK